MDIVFVSTLHKYARRNTYASPISVIKNAPDSWHTKQDAAPASPRCPCHSTQPSHRLLRWVQTRFPHLTHFALLHAQLTKAISLSDGNSLGDRCGRRGPRTVQKPRHPKCLEQEQATKPWTTERRPRENTQVASSARKMTAVWRVTGNAKVQQRPARAPGLPSPLRPLLLPLLQAG